MPIYVQAGLWGLLSGAALVIGAALAWFVRMPARAIAAITAFGAGVLISALSFDLMDQAQQRGGFLPTAAGFLGGAVVYTLANVALAHYGARHRKRSGSQQAEEGGSGLAIAVGALLDGIPESVVIGVSLLSGGGVSLVAVAAVFLSNLPEGLASAAGMRAAGRSAAYVFGVWIGIALLSGLAALLGNLFMAGAGAGAIAFVTAIAAGAILAMLADTMIPEAFETAHNYAGLITVLGFLTAFVLTKMGG
ncbi:ZIP family metal transporter [Muricoccus pecuniae]|uniref:ZIP family zinc transporter n=1 Tax=Muricoccus pecuniae TaxID=693023 RepID=A0A840XY35_9PROT|nr:ZIP family zinc transporter [Roseomonas pecuniae]MBB5692806.1 ZIP family zinc transporter [Roseomonas pecuniae]